MDPYMDGGASIAELAGVGAPGIPDFIYTDPAEFHKAVTAGYGTDVAGLTGGGALRLQSIEATLLATIPQQKHFVAWRKINQSNATATSDEFTVYNAIGGYPGSAFNSELGEIAESQGDFARKTLSIKYLMSRRQVSKVQQSQKTLVDTIANQKVDATLELLQSVEWGIFYGDASVLALEFDGLFKLILGVNDADLIIDAAGKGLSYMANEVVALSGAIASQGRFGDATDVFCSIAVKNQEFDQKVAPAVRIPLNQGAGQKSYDIGTPLRGIQTTQGPVELNPDVYIEEGRPPWEARGTLFASRITAAGLTAPTVDAPVAAPASGSKFVTSQAGNYYYGVESVGKLGRSTTVVSAQVAVVAGDGVTIVINHPSDANVTGFFIHRSRRNGTNAKADLREMIRIPRASGSTTTYVDKNADVPGTSPVFVVNLAPGQEALTVRRLLPLTQFPLYPTNTATVPWAVLLFCALRMGKEKHHGIIRNVLPNGAAWQPF
jgi:hypothetical protein